jgi:hypothetical protein
VRGRRARRAKVRICRVFEGSRDGTSAAVGGLVTQTTASTRRSRETLFGDSRGAVMSEYIVLTATVGIVVAAAAASIGVPLVMAFRYAQAFLVLPFP